MKNFLPFRPKGRNQYRVQFPHPVRGYCVRGLGTTDLSEARRICRDIQAICSDPKLAQARAAGPESVEEADFILPPLIRLHVRAVAAYYGPKAGITKRVQKVQNMAEMQGARKTVFAALEVTQYFQFERLLHMSRLARGTSNSVLVKHVEDLRGDCLRFEKVIKALSESPGKAPAKATELIERLTEHWAFWNLHGQESGLPTEFVSEYGKYLRETLMAATLLKGWDGAKQD